MTVCLTCLGPVYGHHSFAAEFDSSKPITLTGAVTKMEWMNPHAQLFVGGWQFEMASPNALLRLGWTKTSLVAGDVVTVKGFLAKNRSHFAKAESVTLSSGRKLF